MTESRLSEVIRAGRIALAALLVLLVLLAAALPGGADDGSDRAVAGRRIRRTAEDILSSPEFQNFPRLQRSRGGGLPGRSGSVPGLRGGGRRGDGGAPGGGLPGGGGMPGGGMPGGEQPADGGESERRLGPGGQDNGWRDRLGGGSEGHGGNGGGNDGGRDALDRPQDDFPEIDEPRLPRGEGGLDDRNPADDPNDLGNDPDGGANGGENGRGDGNGAGDAGGQDGNGGGPGGDRRGDAGGGMAGRDEPGGGGRNGQQPGGRDDENAPTDRRPGAGDNPGRAAEPGPPRSQRAENAPPPRTSREERERSERSERPERSSSGLSGLSAAIGQLMHLLAFAVLVAIVMLIVWLVFKALKDFRLPRRLSDKGEADVALPAADDGLETAPGGQPPDVYVAQARKLAAAGHYREAIAQLVLGAMSRTERAGWVRFRRGLTVRDYLRALQPHAGQHAAFRAMVRVFEPVSFGRREPTSALFEQSLAGYESGFATEPPAA
jgi:hypothetical protein